MINGVECFDFQYNLIVFDYLSLVKVVVCADNYEEVSSYEKPNLISAPQHFRVKVGDHVRLPCQVDKNGPHLSLVWKREYGDILTTGPHILVRDSRISLNGNSLLIRNISLPDQGTYMCIGYGGEIRHIIDITGMKLSSITSSFSSTSHLPVKLD